MKLYSVAVVRIVIEFDKRSKSALHLFHVRWTFVLLQNSAALRSYFLRDIVLVYIRFMTDGDSVELSFTFVSCGHSLHVGPV